MAIATVDELRDYMSSVGLSNDQWDAAELVIEAIQHELELYLNRPLQPTLVREWKSVGCDGFVYLSVTPIHSIRSVASVTGAVSPDGTPFTLDPIDKTDYENNYVNAVPTNFNGFSPAKGGLYLTDVYGYGNPWTYVVVEYVGGYLGYSNAALKRGILEIASRIMTNNHDDTMSIKEGLARETQQVTMPSKFWTDEELRRFDRLRRRIVI